MDNEILPQKKSPIEIHLSKDEKQANFLALRSRALNPEQKQYSLDFFCNASDSKKLQPNDIARSALWTVKTSVEREYLENAPIFSSDPTLNIFYTGKALQATTDEKVWLQLVFYARSAKFGDVVSVKISDICKDIGWARNGHYYATVWASLERLHYAGLKIKKGKNRIVAFIRMLNLHTAKGDDIRNDGIIEYSLDNALNGWLLLVAGGTVTLLESSAMKRIKPIAQRLYTYTASHKDPLPLAIADFHKMCGSDANINTVAGLAKWRQSINKAIVQLQNENLIVNGWIENEHIFIKRR